jgi:hypothetical protein
LVVVIELAGGACLLAGITALALGVFALRDDRVIARTAPTPIGSWHSAARWRAAIARTAYGPGGRYISPVTGRECAWYVADLIRIPSRRIADESVGEDSLWRSTAPQPAAIVDETGLALLDPHLTESPPTRNDAAIGDATIRVFRAETIDTIPPAVPPHAYADVRGHESLRLVEVCVPVGRPVYVFGAIARHGGHLMVVPAKRGPTIVTRDSLADVRSRRRRSARESRRVARGLTIVGAVLSVLATALLYVLPAA